jgi:5'-nucleotidase/UDP-sugar diphosphatase
VMYSLQKKFSEKKVLARLVVISILLTCISLVVGCCDGSQQTSYQLTILHTNDIHGQFLPVCIEKDGDTISIGGFEALSHYVSEERNEKERVLLLDAGDIMTGNLICDIEYEGALGGGLIEMMNQIGYDALVPGNHMFDHSISNMRALSRVANFPFICCNLEKKGEIPSWKPYVIISLDGLQVGIIGVTYHPMVGMVPAPRLQGYLSLEPTKVVASLIEEIDPGTDVIILLSHAGINNDLILAEKVPGIDLIVSGHNHALLDTLLDVNSALIAQAGSNCQYLGIVDLLIVGDTVQTYSNRLLQLRAESIQPDTAVSRMVREFGHEIDRDYNHVIGELVCHWRVVCGDESNVGNWLTDAIRRRLNTDVAFVNTGGIRKNLDKGPITKRDIMEMLPFDNYLVVFECTGEQLLQIAKHNLGGTAEGYPMALQISGLAYTWSEVEGKSAVVDAMVDGVLIDPNRVYSVASIDYIVEHNSERYFGFKVKDFSLHIDKMTPAIIDEVLTAKQIDSKIEGRIRRLE